MHSKLDWLYYGTPGSLEKNYGKKDSRLTLWKSTLLSCTQSRSARLSAGIFVQLCPNQFLYSLTINICSSPLFISFVFLIRYQLSTLSTICLTCCPVPRQHNYTHQMLRYPRYVEVVTNSSCLFCQLCVRFWTTNRSTRRVVRTPKM